VRDEDNLVVEKQFFAHDAIANLSSARVRSAIGLRSASAAAPRAVWLRTTGSVPGSR